MWREIKVEESRKETIYRNKVRILVVSEIKLRRLERYGLEE